MKRRSDYIISFEVKMIKRHKFLAACFTTLIFAGTGTAISDDSPGGRRIIGGDPTTIEKHPWQVAINIHVKSSPYLCGGSLLNRRWVLTAAHCLKGATTKNLQVKAGVTDYKTTGKWLMVDRVEPHPSFNPQTFENDIGLVRLKEDFLGEGGDGIIMAGSATVLEKAGLEVTGWGVTETGFTSARLLKVNVPYVDNKTCNLPASYNGKILDSMLCAGAEGKDSCQGDSGGPAVLYTKSGPLLVGVVSNGDGCAKELKYGVYTRVSSHLAWINGTTKE